MGDVPKHISFDKNQRTQTSPPPPPIWNKQNFTTIAETYYVYNVLSKYIFYSNKLINKLYP